MLRTLPLTFLALAALTIAGPISPSPNSPQTPQDQTTLDNFPPQQSLEFSFTPNSQYSQQELRRLQRKFLENAGKLESEGAAAFQRSPYGSGAVPVPPGSAEVGFGGRTLF